MGVAATQLAVVRDLEWLFREQPTDDYGIDAQIEVVEDEKATGRLIAAQIKSGPSYFDKPVADGWWFKLDRDDVEYWLDHSLPVIIVIYDPAADATYWQVVSISTVVTGPRGGKKILIPSTQKLDASALKQLIALADGKPYELHLRQLRLALPWMRLLQGGRRVLLEADEWVNKMSGRGDLQIISVNDANEDRRELGTWHLMAGLRRYEDVLPSLVPWADVVLHEETYEDADYEAWEAECVVEDREGDRMEFETYDDWHRKFDNIGLRPYANSAGEVDHWRLELVLNELGRGFLSVDEFAEGDGMMLTP